MVVLTIGLVSLAELLAVSLRLQQLGRNGTSAVRLAQDKMDQLMSLNFDTAAEIAIAGSLTADVANHFDNQAGPDGTLGNADDIEVLTGHTRRWLVEAGPDGNANLRQVTVRIVPLSSDNRTTAPYELVSIIRRW